MSAETLPQRVAVLEIAEFDDASPGGSVQLAALPPPATAAVVCSVVYDPRVSQVHLLDAVTSVVLDACDGVTTVDELATDMAVLGGPDEPTALIAAALESLARAGLLDGFDPPPLCIGCVSDSGTGHVRSILSWRSRR